MITPQRLLLELHYLEAKFPGRFMFRDMDTDLPYLDCSIKSNTENIYRLKIILDGFPAEKPEVYITHPKPLLGFEGINLAEIHCSPELHLLSPDDFGNVQICHYNEDWDGGNTLLAHVLIHSKMWIEAYENYKRTGDPLDNYLKH
jgi:hypothetical protein